ncbi:PH domain-containing protein [Bacteroidota bacterium]
MEQTTYKPHPEQKILSVNIARFYFCLICVPLLLLTLLLDYPANLILGIILAFNIIIFSLILIYVPAYYRNLEYFIDNESVKQNKGVFWKKRITVPYRKITNIDISQGPLQRKKGLFNISLQTAGAGGAQGAAPELKMEGIKNPEEIKNIIMENILNKEAVKDKSLSEQAVELTSNNEIVAELKNIRILIENLTSIISNR